MMSKAPSRRFSCTCALFVSLLLLSDRFWSIDAKKMSSTICREESLDAQDPIATADIIVIGSGPGGTGFLHRFSREMPDMTVLWIEKGLDFLATNWPQNIADVDERVLTPVPRANKRMIAYAWNNFGGGDAGNSGGPNYNGMGQAPYEPVDVVSLRNNSLIPLTPTSERWTRAFQEAGFEDKGAIYSRRADSKLVGQLSSLRREDGRQRLLLANDLRYSQDNNINYVHARVTSIIHEQVVDENGHASLRATGVRGVRVATDNQGEYGGCVTWRANKAVVLAGGIFNSFDLLVESGLGPEEALDVRNVPENWRHPNEEVGKGVGDEFTSIYVSVEPEKQDQFGAEPRLVAETPVGFGAYEMFGHGIYTWLRVSNTFYNRLFGRFLPRRLPLISKVIKKIFGRMSFISVSIFHEPSMVLIATPKPRNVTSSTHNPLGVTLDDSMIQMTEHMCARLTANLEPFKKGAKLQKDAKKEFSFARLLLAVGSRLGITRLLSPNPITAQNIETFTGRGKNKGKKCSMNQIASYYHFYGGNSKAINDKYILTGTQNLFISDASIIDLLLPGAPSPVVMEHGMKVADALIDTLG